VEASPDAPAAAACFVLRPVEEVRLYPRAGQAARMQGGKIVASNESPTDGFVDIADLASAPPDGQWTALPVSSRATYRFVKYYGPAGSYGDVAELEFESGGARLAGSVFATPSADQATHTGQSAFDGDVTTYFEGAVSDNQYVGLDLAAGHVAATPVITPPAGAYASAQEVALGTATPGAVLRYTTDGSDPTSGAVYAGPFAVSSTTTVRAVATAPCMIASAIAESLYTIGAPTKTAQSSFHIGNSLTGPLISELPAVVATQSMFSLDFHNCVTSGVDVSDFWADMPPPGCYDLGVNPLPTPATGPADPKVALADPSLLPPIDNLVVQPFAVNTCTPYSDATHTGDAGYANDFYQLAKSKNNPAVQLWDYATWAAPTAQSWSSVDCFANGGYGTPPWPAQGTTLPAAVDWESATRNHLLYHEAVRSQVDLLNGVDPSDPSSPGPHALIVPMGLALINLKHEVEAGTVHDVATTAFFTTFFGSNGTDLHITNAAGYFDALVFYSCFFKASPEGLPFDSTLVTAAEAADLQRIAWQTVSGYAWAGLK
jgi:hypothetical protein